MKNKKYKTVYLDVAVHKILKRISFEQETPITELLTRATQLLQDEIDFEELASGNDTTEDL